MSFEWIKKAYGVECHKGQQGTYKREPITVVGASNYVKVRFDTGFIANIHPTDNALKLEVHE